MAVTTNNDVYAINNLAHYLLPQMPRYGRAPVTAEKAAEALAHLAEAAYRKHAAGVTGEQIRAEWAKNPPVPAGGERGAPSIEDAQIIDGRLRCPHCTACDTIVEVDSDTRRNEVSASGADSVIVIQSDSCYATDRYECSACQGVVDLPYDITFT
ncbi:hypothetical protein [Spirillospora sp. CA-294931]|uniref:hypothetical protein n=1 Tax=Spirillospora sp. CA-294931 TaxID=3240042 RepID=UPI003D8A8081